MTARSKTTIVLGGLLVLSVAGPVRAQTLETESARVLPARTWEVGSAFEVQTSSEGTERALPFALVYGLTRRLEIMVEPVAYTAIRPKAGQRATGAGDVEVTLTYKFHQETALLPAFAIAGELKQPTARNRLIGTGRPDYAAYVSGSKRFGPVDLHAHTSYTFIGQPTGAQLGNIVGFGVAAVYAASARLDVFTEVLGNSASTPASEGGAGSGVALLAVPEASGGELVATLGTAWRAAPRLSVYVSGSRDNIGAILWRIGFVIHSR